MNLTEFSRKGGQAGRGASKRRSKEHYAKLAQCGVEARRARKWAKQNGTTLEQMGGLPSPPVT